MLILDGSTGEGGGQVLRSALALSLVTGTPFRLDRVRAGRAKPGLLRQHLACVRAAAAFGQAEVEGDALGSATLTFRPTTLRGGEVEVAVGSAGSAMLVIQAVLPALLRAPGPSRLRVEGGTHNPAAPPAPFLERVFLPLLERMGARVRLEVERPGFFPAGGGAVVVEVSPSALSPLELDDREGEVAWTATALLSGLPEKVGRRELGVLGLHLPVPRSEARVVQVERPVGPGNALWAEATWSGGRALFTGFGEKRRTSQQVAEGVAAEALAWAAAGVPVCAHLADQLLIPMALAQGGAFTTLAPTLHTTTNAWVIEQFLPVKFGFEPVREGVVRVRCSAGR